MVSGNEVTQSPTERDGQRGGGKRLEEAAHVTGVTAITMGGTEKAQVNLCLNNNNGSSSSTVLVLQAPEPEFGPPHPCENQAQKHL